MNKLQFREDFKAFLANPERYNKFVRLVNRTDRLLYWQERQLELFCSQNLLQVPTFEEIKTIFRFCELHGDELQQGEVKVFTGHVDYSAHYIQAMTKHFPNSRLCSVNGPKEMYGKTYTIWYCQQCRDVEKHWKT